MGLRGIAACLAACTSLLPADGVRQAFSDGDESLALPDAPSLVQQNATTQGCRWDEEVCCCEFKAPRTEGLKRKSVSCKRWTTGIREGKERCGCGDLEPSWLGFTEPSHKPETWANSKTKKLWMKGMVGGDHAKLALQDMQAQCQNPATPVVFEGERPDGSCTVKRLFKNALPEFMKGRSCATEKEAKSKSWGKNLENSKLLNAFHERLTHAALMGCAAISEGCSTLSFTDSVLEKVLDNLDTSFMSLGSRARTYLMEYAQQSLMTEAGLDETTAKLLLDWAFYHQEGTNPYCDKDLMSQHRDMLVKGLTAAEEGHVAPQQAWTYSEEEVYTPFRDLLTMTIEGMFQADCEKPTEPEVEEAKAMAGEGVDISTVAEPLLPFRDVPLIGSLLDYMEHPFVKHPIEANEADLVRRTLKTLGNLLSNEEFVGHLKRKGGAFDDWDMPAEVERLWAKTKAAKHGDRIWEDDLIEKLREPSKEDVHCDCSEIEPLMGVHMLNQLPYIGVDFGNVELGSDGKLTSDKVTDTLQHVDLQAFTTTMIMVEAGIQDPQLATKYTVQKMLRGAEATGSQSGVPDVSASGKVKGVLVGMPIIQNLWALLEKDEGFSPAVFAKKMKWFFVANIIWAVWHAIESNLPPEDIVLGLITIAMSTVSSFDFDGKWITFSNSKPFTDFMLAVYTVWNYRFVKQWASDGKAEDQWMHVSVALSMPLIEALANHGDVTYYINYRRDGLFQAMLLMMERWNKEAKQAEGRCCCDWDTVPSRWSKVKASDEDLDFLASAQRCVIVPDVAKTSRGKCPPVRSEKWVRITKRKAAFMKYAKKGKFLELHHDKDACSDLSKVLVLQQSAFR